jgi:hypothetical protein
MSKKETFSRRDLLKGLGAVCAMSLVHERMVDQIVGSFVGSAQAAPGMLTDFRYVNFTTPGGIPRWYFDLPIAPNGNDPYIANKQVITSMRMGADNNPIGEYAHTKMGDFYLPLLWSYSIPLSSGGTGNLNELASSALFIRGVDQGLDGHEFNLLRQNSPVPGGMTYSGLFADTGETPIPAARSGGLFEHRSAKNKAIIPFAYRADLKVLSTSFNSFKTSNPKSFNRRDMAQRTIEAAIKSIQKTQGANSPYMSAVKANRDNAMELLSSDFATIDADYEIIYNKYQNLIMAALKMPLPGVTTAPIYAVAGDSRFNIFIPEYNPGLQATAKTGDIRLGFENILPSPAFAHAFALAEFLITKNLSSSVVADLGFWSNFDIMNYNSFNAATQKYDRFESASSYKILGSDVHSTGTFPALIMFARHFHAYATCLHEFTTVLKAKNIYDQTLIHTTSDFNRIPRTDGSGSDHGFSGCATSVFSGRIKQTLVVGNVAQNISARGTWGEAANVSALGDRKINLGNVASTICSIFDLPTPAQNDSSLVTLGANKLVIAPKDKPKNVA